VYVAAIEDIAHGEGMAETVWVDIIDAGIVADALLKYRNF